MTMRVKLTYFKSWNGPGDRGGKFYSDGEYISEHDPDSYWKALDEVEKLRDDRRLPGLCENHGDYHVLFETDPESVPHLFVAPHLINPHQGGAQGLRARVWTGVVSLRYAAERATQTERIQQIADKASPAAPAPSDNLATQLIALAGELHRIRALAMELREILYARTVELEATRMSLRQSIAENEVYRQIRMSSIDVVLFCPACGLQHIDAPEPETGWENPPHRSHCCHGCQHTWRPADVPTNGVAQVLTSGKQDKPTPELWPRATALVCLAIGQTLLGRDVGKVPELSKLTEDDIRGALMATLRGYLVRQPESNASEFLIWAQRVLDGL